MSTGRGQALLLTALLSALHTSQCSLLACPAVAPHRHFGGLSPHLPHIHSCIHIQGQSKTPNQMQT
jgi:hypothetical protein